MFDVFSEKMLTEMFNALQKGEQYNYSDGNMHISISPNGIKVQYSSEPKVKKDNTKETAVDKFLTYCDKLDDEFFVEVCNTFTGEEIEKLQELLKSDPSNFQARSHKIFLYLQNLTNSNLWITIF